MNSTTEGTPLSNAPPLVVHVVTSLDYGGVERHMELIAGFLGDAKMRHMFVAIGAGGATEKKLRTLGAEVKCLCRPTKIPSFSALIDLLKVFRRKRPTIVHTHGAEANFHGLLAAWFVGVPVRVGEEIGIPNHRFHARWIFRLVYKTSHCVIGISDAVRNWLIKNREINEKKAHRIYNPVNIQIVKSESKDSNVFRVGFVGRLEPVKNPVGLLEAVFKLRKMMHSFEVLIIGEGSQRPLLEKLISDWDLSNHVHLLGYQKDPIPYLLKCNIYIQPSLSEGFGLALVEAMGCGLPAIASAIGGAPEIINHGKTGWLLSEPTSENIFETIKAAYELGEKQLHDMGVQAQKSVLGRFEPRKYIENIEKLYETISAV